VKVLAAGCSGLSDCASGVNVGLVLVGIVLAVVLWDVLAALAPGAGTETATAGATLDASELRLSDTAANHAGTHPFAASRLLLQEIMDAAEPVADPQGALGAVRWDVPGRFNGCAGTWELVVNANERVIYRFDFVR
jgi:hypothetical protein